MKKYSDFSNIKEAIDLISILKERHPGSSLYDIGNASDIEEIYLFFDYDFQQVLSRHRHAPEIPIADLLAEDDKHIEEMLDFFDEETEMGKLYINYPMVESLYYTKEMPDNDYKNYDVSLEGCESFKKDCSDFTFYKGYHGIILQNNANPEVVKGNWEKLKIQNINKANLLCNGTYAQPMNKSDIDQNNIFQSQKNKYNNEGLIGILNSFPLFLYEYFK